MLRGRETFLGSASVLLGQAELGTRQREAASPHPAHMTVLPGGERGARGWNSRSCSLRAASALKLFAFTTQPQETDLLNRVRTSKISLLQQAHMPASKEQRYFWLQHGFTVYQAGLLQPTQGFSLPCFPLSWRYMLACSTTCPRKGTALFLSHPGTPFPF